MARQKRTSRSFEKARLRAAGMRTIVPTLDLGADLSIQGFLDALNSLEQDLDAYNSLLAKVDQIAQIIRIKEKTVNRLSGRMLAAVVAKYGRDSIEYEMAGGKAKATRRFAMPETLPTEIS